MSQIWSWQHDDFPNFTYDKNELEKNLLDLERERGELLGKIQFLNSDEELEFTVQNRLEEIVTNSEIEGVILRRDSVRSSILKKLGYEILEQTNNEEDSRHTDNLASIVLDVSTNMAPLDIDRLHRWHYEFFQFDNPNSIKLGTFRDDAMSITASSRGVVQRVVFQAPPVDDIKKHIDNLVKYCNTSNDTPYIKSGIAHLLFETIHPYEDGNGRVGRSLADHILSKEFGLDNRYISISWAINAGKDKYYEIMEQTNTIGANPNIDLTRWLSWYTSTIKQTLQHSNKIIDQSINKTRFYDHVKSLNINDKQLKIIDYLYDNQSATISTNFYKELNNLKHSVTASRQIKSLVEKGLLINASSSRGRSTSYKLSRDIFL